jgi:hypothetical protein
LSYSGHVLMENRSGMVADVEVLQANGTAERDAALVMLERIEGDHTGCDKLDLISLLSKTNTRIATHVASRGFASPVPKVSG